MRLGAPGLRQGQGSGFMEFFISFASMNFHFICIHEGHLGAGLTLILDRGRGVREFFGFYFLLLGFI